MMTIQFDEDLVTRRTDRLVLRLPGGEVALRHPHGGPIDGFHPGWRPRFLFVHFRPIHLLELVDGHGNEATWYVAEDGERITDQIVRLPDQALRAISEHVADWIADPASRAAQDARAAHAQLNARTRAQIPLTGFLSDIVFDPLVLIDGTACLRGRFGGPTALRLPPGAPPAPATARLLHTGFAPLHVLEFAARERSAEPWFVHADGTFLGTSLDAVPPSLLAPVRRQGLVRRIAREAAPSAVAPAPDGFMLLSPSARTALEALAPRLDPGPGLERLQSGLAFAAGGKRLHTVATIRPQEDTGRFRRLSSGWFIDANGCAWILGTCSFLELEVPEPSSTFRLRLDIAVVRDGTRMTLSIDGRMISSSLLCSAQNHGTSLSCFIPPELVRSERVRVEFAFDPPLEGPHSAFRLDMASLSADGEAHAPAPGRPADHELLGHFESLGDSCELGFAQRHVGLEPISLLRFAGTFGLTSLIRLIETRFEGLGAPGSLRSTINFFNGRQEYMIWADACGMFYHTWRDPADINEADVLAENEAKLAYLGRKLIEDLEDGEKIFVYKRNATRDLGEILSLHAALNQYGPNKLFWISQLEDGRQPCEVEWVAPDLLKGYSASFGRAETPAIDIWLKLCRSACVKFAERPRTGASPRAQAAPVAPPTGIVQVAGGPSDEPRRIAAAGVLARLRKIFIERQAGVDAS